MSVGNWPFVDVYSVVLQVCMAVAADESGGCGNYIDIDINWVGAAGWPMGRRRSCREEKSEKILPE